MKDNWAKKASQNGVGKIYSLGREDIRLRCREGYTHVELTTEYTEKFQKWSFQYVLLVSGRSSTGRPVLGRLPLNSWEPGRYTHAPFPLRI